MMEFLYYKCPVCGFRYQVPAYWSDFEAEPTMELAHIDLMRRQDCHHTTLELEQGSPSPTQTL